MQRKVGLKDLLSLSFVGYDYPKHLKGFQPATRITGIIKMLNDDLRMGDYQKLTPTMKRHWANLIKYNEHDYRGMKWLLEFLVTKEGFISTFVSP